MKSIQKFRLIDLPLNMGVAALYIILAKIGLFFVLQSTTITIFWPAGGFALALLLLAGLHYMPGIFAGAFAAGLMVGDSIGISATTAVGNAMESFAAYWLLTHYLNFHRELDTRQDFFKLTLLAGATASCISALIGPTSLLLGGIIPADIFPQVVLRWWMGDFLGIVFLTPLILVWSKPRQQTARTAEVFTLLSLTFLAGQAIFFDWFKSFAEVSPSIAWIIPLIIWSGMRAGRHTTAALQLMIFIQALWSASHGIGNYADEMMKSGLVNFWMFGIVIALGGMALAVMSAESHKIHREWQQLHKSISSSLNEIYLFDAETLFFFFANEGARRNLGYSMNELRLMTPLDLKPSHTDQSFQALVSPLLRHEQAVVVFETIHKRKDSSLYPVEVHLQLIAENCKPYFQAIILDITERKLSEQYITDLNNKLEEKVLTQFNELTATNLNLVNKVEELRRSKSELRGQEAKIKSIFNAAVEGIITYDKTGIIVSANAAVETIFGHQPEALVGANINRLIPFSSREKNYCSLPHAVESIGQILEIEGLHKNGSVVPLDLSVAEFTIDNEHYFTAIVRDVSLRKYREQQGRKHLEELAHVTRLGMMGEMASGIAHEVNQPLTAIASYSQASLNLINSETPDLVKLNEIIHKTEQQALKAGQIINRMRKFIQYNTNQRTATDINHLINEAVSLSSDGIKQNNIKLTLDLQQQLPNISVDHVQIEQVLINLIRNSIDALKSKPEKHQRLLTIRSGLTLDHYLQVDVKDNGPGIEEAQKQNIFMPFHSTKAEGLGMGLSICQSIIEAHEGALSFNSQLEKGTTFYFLLPLMPS